MIEVDILRAEGIGDGLVEAVLVDKAAVDHGLGNGLAVQARLVEDVIGLGGLEDVLLDEKFGDLFIVHGFSWRPRW